MKRFKIGFLAVIAIVATSFTIASHEGAFKKDSGTCNQGTDLRAGTTYYTNGECNGTTGTITTCNLNLVGKFIANPLTVNVTSFDCDGGTTTFCCAEVSSETCLDAEGEEITGSKIDKIICKSQSE